MLAISSPPKLFRSRQLRVDHVNNSNNVVSKSLPIRSPLTIKPAPKMSSPCTTPSSTTAPLIPDKILPNLYISDIHTAAAVLSPHYNAPGLDRPKIKYVLSVIDGQDKQPKVPPGHESEFVLKFVSLRDSPTDDILKILGNAIAFIQTSLTNNDGGVLVHCQKGVSRSGSVMIGFIMEEMNLNYDTALRYVRSSRSKIRPNSGFEQQLILWGTLRYNIHDDQGNEKPEYIAWKKENEAKIKAPRIANQI